MSFQLPPIYPITNTFLTQLSHLEQVEQLVDGGAKIIQLREKSGSSKEFYKSAKRVMEFVRGTDIKVIINDRVDIALIVKADGVHLGQDDLPPISARELLGKDAIIGYSTHSVTQAIEAIQLPIDYIAIGPVFDTTTKEHSDATIGLDGLRIVRQAIGSFPLVAIGGINFGNYLEVIKNGADSVAMISSILAEPQQISANFARF